MSATEKAVVDASYSAVDIGLLLREQRIQKNLSIDVVAKELRLSAQQIIALEAGDFSGFRGSVFVKGHLRASARLYGMDADALVQAYDQLAPQEEIRLSPMRAHVNRDVLSSSDRRNKYLWLLLPVCLALVVLLGNYLSVTRYISTWFSVLSSDASPIAMSASTTPATETTEASQTAPLTAPPLAEAPIAAPLPALISASAVSAPEVQSESGTNNLSPVNANPISTNNQAESTAVDPQDSVLHMEFSDDCWVQIKDQTGKVLHEKNYHKDQVLDMTVQPPLYIWLGRAAAANVSYNGTLVDIPTRPGFQSAKFVLGDDTQFNRVE